MRIAKAPLARFLAEVDIGQKLIKAISLLLGGSGTEWIYGLGSKSPIT